MKTESLDNPLDMLLGFLGTIRYYAWWIAFGTIGLSLIGITFVALSPDYYRATTTILVDPQKVPENYVRSTVTIDPAQRLSTISQEVLSTTRLQEVIDRLHLYEQQRKVMGREEVINLMRSSISIDLKQGAGFSAFTIAYQGRDPKVVAQVTNQLASSFMQWNLESREQQSIGTTEFLNGQLQQAKQSLEEQERKLREYKMQYVGEMPDQQPANLQVLSQLQSTFQANNDALNRLDLQRTLILRSESRTGAGAPPADRARLQTEKRQLEDKLYELRHRYTNNFPDVADAERRLERIKAQLQALPPEDQEKAGTGKGSEDDVQLMVIDRERKRLTAEQNRIQAQIRTYQARIEAAPIREQQILNLTRNYEVSKGLYQSLLDKTFSAEMANDLERKQKAERFTILDPARVPEKPYKPKRLPMMFAAFMGPLIGCIGLAIGKDMLDPTLKREAEVKQMLEAPVPLLLAIPTIEIPADRRRRILFVSVGIGVSLLGCLLEAGLLWKIHPIL
jgi:succinoglycan biosynthesis transport protein ExoP